MCRILGGTYGLESGRAPAQHYRPPNGDPVPSARLPTPATHEELTGHNQRSTKFVPTGRGRWSAERRGPGDTTFESTSEPTHAGPEPSAETLHEGADEDAKDGYATRPPRRWSSDEERAHLVGTRQDRVDGERNVSNERCRHSEQPQHRRSVAVRRGGVRLHGGTDGVTARIRWPACSSGRTCVAGPRRPHSKGRPPSSAIKREAPRRADNLVDELQRGLRPRRSQRQRAARYRARKPVLRRVPAADRRPHGHVREERAGQPRGQDHQ